jgi:hypothetical protein
MKAEELYEEILEMEDYFAQRADADQEAGDPSPRPNEEMKHLVTVAKLKQIVAEEIELAKAES